MSAVAGFLTDSTTGLFPLVAYSVSQDSLLILTTNIIDLPYAIRILEDVTRAGYNLSYSLRPEMAQRLSGENPHVFHASERKVPRIHEIELRRIGRLVATFGAPFYHEKGFALVDVCGFSRLDNPDQLAQLYSLTNAVDSAIRRSYRVCQKLKLPNRFGRASTGDGFYLWHDHLGAAADVAAFFLLVCIMTQSESMRLAGFPMRLRASFVIDSAFMLYDADARTNPYAVASNAVGTATNTLARFIAAAKPSQILLGEFSPRRQPGEKMDSASFLAQVNELFREEGFGAATLEAKPNKLLRVDDKHGDVHYCWNIAGEVPKQAGKRTTLVHIGLQPHDATRIDDVDFVHT